MLKDFTCFLLITLLIGMLSGCDQQQNYTETAVPPQQQVEIPLWLDGDVAMSPQQWLVKRSRAEVTDEAETIAETGEILVAASAKYDESHRMIANRVAQLEDMLHEQHQSETALQLLHWFVDLPVLITPHAFSALCQYYSTLRARGNQPDEIAAYWSTGESSELSH